MSESGSDSDSLDELVALDDEVVSSEELEELEDELEAELELCLLREGTTLSWVAFLSAL